MVEVTLADQQSANTQYEMVTLEYHNSIVNALMKRIKYLELFQKTNNEILGGIIEQLDHKG